MALGSAEVDGSIYTRFVTGRNSTRVYQDKPVSRQLVEKIIGDAIEAPTSCNRQLWHFIVVDDPAVKARLNKESDAQQSYLHDAPVIIALFYDTSLEPRNPCNTAQVTVGMATYGLLLAAEAEGLGAIYLGGIRNPKGACKALGVPSFWANYGFVCLGYRADQPPAPIPRPVASVISYNRYDLPEKRYHMDIRPHLWSLSQLADFRDKLLWYKGIAIDGKTLHVDPDARFSRKFHHLAVRAAQLAATRHNPVVLDFFSLNGDVLLQLVNAIGPGNARFLAYDLTPGIGDFIAERFRRIFPSLPYEYLLNPDPARVHIPVGDHAVHVLTCYERLDQFEDPLPLLREMRRALHPDGTALVMVSGRFYPHLYRYRRMRQKNYALGRNWNRGPERKFNPSEIEAAFQEAGFKVVDMAGYQPVTLKLLQWTEQLARKAGLTAWADRFASERTDHLLTRSFDRFFSSSLLYEIRPETR
ncbi:MAG: nitroreductase family protein [Candidatus Methylacidiphilales bacterium]|nr:nitroreductase family protein [Candidatus Methylacidiphilales bacterium]